VIETIKQNNEQLVFYIIQILEQYL